MNADQDDLRGHQHRGRSRPSRPESAGVGGEETVVTLRDHLGAVDGEVNHRCWGLGWSSLLRSRVLVVSGRQGPEFVCPGAVGGTFGPGETGQAHRW